MPVEVDDELTSMFQASKRAKTSDEADPISSKRSEASQAPIELPAWLQQFKPVDKSVSEPLVQTDSDFGFVSFVKNECRPFWRTMDDTEMKRIWKASRAALAADCKKQKKAAVRLRKTRK
jgi:hypothetical protein